ncbi:peptide chain release factor N(5)-glutamine methyltransferase [Desulfonatronum thioautotrophicum]|uniref:peptide chain release factor N(5)-glutamine methyltransferase n=1 Tax=Desulfonatronum thioautotrophicum TaxID=617001 RepID=UPI0005EAF102|nr:peptide chain release factor N(5)-glutamine methyltransferase [Desulfonatronum thioautotrophicum]
MSVAPHTLREILDKCTRFLKEKRVDSPRLSAELLVAEALGGSRLELFLDLDKPLREPELARIRPLLVRRGNGEPMAYILGRREFYGLDFHVSPEVLIPRPDTELGVERALTMFSRDDCFFFADVGTGSGALATTLLTLFPRACCIASDISYNALLVAQGNLHRHHVLERCLLVQGNLLGHFGPSQLDLIIANLPYIGERSTASLSREVLDFEPHLALFGGDDGDELFVPFLEDVQLVVAPGGGLLMEVDPAQVPRVCHWLKSYSPRRAEVGVHKDLGGHERYIQARFA